jgi:hypothetical protein
MDQSSENVNTPTPAFDANRLLLIAGLAQVAAAFTPAGHVRFSGPLPFIRLPNAGIAFIVLGVFTALVALRPRGWWRWIPGLASAILLAIVYARLRWEPSGGFADPLLRRMVRPAWGFYPMALSILFALGAAARTRIGRRDQSAVPQPATHTRT